MKVNGRNSVIACERLVGKGMGVGKTAEAAFTERPELAWKYALTGPRSSSLYIIFCLIKAEIQHCVTSLIHF